MRLFIFGAGYSGRAIGIAASEAGAGVTGTTRSPDKAETLHKAGIEPLLFDGSELSPEIAQRLHDTTHLVVSIAPDHGMRARDTSQGQSNPSPALRATSPQGGEESRCRDAGTTPAQVALPSGERWPEGPVRGKPEGGGSDDRGPSTDPVLSTARTTILSATPSLRWIGYLSTVGVYGDHGGGWIDETAECRPASRRSRMRLVAEREWQALADEAGVPLAILRLSGIYGPGRNGFVNLDKGTARRIVKPGQVFNRVHVDDIAAATLFLAERGIGGVFNVTDDEPAPPQDVVAHAASLMGVTPPPEIAFDEAEMTPMARSFYGENKRVSNARLKAAGFRFRYPDYRVALSDLWTSGRWRGV